MSGRIRRPQPQPIKWFVALRPDLTYKELARKVGVSQHWMSEIVNGYEWPSDWLRAAIARELGVSESRLFVRPEREEAHVGIPDHVLKLAQEISQGTEAS